MPRLRHKTALITGAARGIGLAIAQAFAREGATVWMTDTRDEAGRLEAGAIGARYERLDVREEVDWERVTGLIRERGSLSIVVNNAGITGFEAQTPQTPQTPPTPPPLQDPEHVDLRTWRSVHAVNLEGAMLGCKHAIRAMRSNEPSAPCSIINIGSRSGVVGIPRAAAYASSKAALRNHTKSVALYAAEENLPIRCNVIQPASILTPMWDAMLGEGPDRIDAMDRFTADTPLRRFGTAQEVAALAVHLASDESAYTTGSEFTIDGGLLAGTAAPPAPSQRS